MTTPKGNAVLVETLGSSLRRGGNALEAVPGLLKRLLAEESWREFVTQRGELVKHDRFAEFVTTPPLRGIGANVDLIKRIVADDPEAERMLRDALKEQGRRSDIRNNRTEVKAVTGTSRAYALQRLERNAPELHAEVLAGKLSAHAAMVKAGYTPPTFTVRADSPESVANALRRRLPPEQIAKLARLLAEGN